MSLCCIHKTSLGRLDDQNSVTVLGAGTVGMPI